MPLENFKNGKYRKTSKRKIVLILRHMYCIILQNTYIYIQGFFKNQYFGYFSKINED